MSIYDGWVLVSPGGAPFWLSARSKRNEVIEQAERYSYWLLKEDATWKQMYRMGYRIKGTSLRR